MAGFEDWTPEELKGFSTGAEFRLIQIKAALPYMASIPKKNYYPNAGIIEEMVIKELGKAGDGYKYETDSSEYRWDTWIGGKPLDDELFYFFFKDEEYSKKFKRRIKWLTALKIKRWLKTWCIRFWQGMLKSLHLTQKQSMN